MTRLATTFGALRSRGGKALVVYLTAGDPDLQTSLEAARAALRAGADVLEVGVPFSDPVADGPVIQRAMNRALAAGGGFDGALELVSLVRKEDSQVPIVVFGYANPWIWHGIDVAARRIAQAGADGVLVVDVPPEEAEPFRRAAAREGLDWVSLVAPTTPAGRARSIAGAASGFVYVVSMTGVTGGALQGLDAVAGTLAAVRAATQLPACIGFGVRDRNSAALAAKHADGVVVGSAIVAALEQGGEKGRGPQRVAECVAELRAGVDAAATGSNT